MADKVVTLREGFALASPGRPDPETVALLERLLEKARAGEVTGLVVVEGVSGGHACWSRSGIVPTFPAIGALEAAKASILNPKGSCEH